MIPEWLSLIDIAFVAVAFLFGLGGLQRGFASQVAHVITLFAVGVTLYFAFPAIFTYMGQLFRNLNETYMMWLILAGLAVLAVVFFIFLTKLLANVLKTQISDRTDRIYGFTLGFIRGVMVALLIMVFMVIWGSAKTYDTFRTKSHVGRLVCYEMVPRIQPHVTRTALEDRVDRLREALIYQEEAGLPDE